MNLKELRNKVKNITDYNPEIQTYLDDLDALINDAYNQLYLSKRWNFGRKTEFLNIYPDIAAEVPVGGGAAVPNLNVLDGRRDCTFSAVVSELLEDPRIWEGQIIEIQGREYTIETVADTGVGIRTVEPLRCTTTSDDLTWQLKHWFYHLPPDAIEILGLCHRDAPVPAKNPLWGKKIGLVARRDEELNLREDYTAEFSEAYVLVPPIDIPAGMKWGTPVITAVGPPAAPNPFLANTKWEFTWAFEIGGIIGPLSDPHTVDIGNVEDNTSPVVTLHFETWDDRPVRAKTYDPAVDIYQNDFEGMKKVVFYNSNYDHTTGTRKGLPCWRQVGSGIAVASRNDWRPKTATDEESSVVLNGLFNVNPGAPRYQEWDGQHLRIRPYPRPQGFEKEYAAAAATGSMAVLNRRKFRQYELRYQRKPYRLCSSTDSPEMPYEFHQLIVYKVLHECFVKGGNAAMAGMYDKKMFDAIKILERRYVDRADTFWQRGQFGMERRGIVYDYNSLRKIN